jgi:hypothetical protein
MNQHMIIQMFISFASLPWSPLDHDSGRPLQFKLCSEKLCMKSGHSGGYGKKLTGITEASLNSNETYM